MSIIFKDRKGQTPLSSDEKQGLKSKLITTIGELDALEKENISKGLLWLNKNKFASHIDYLNTDFSNKLHLKLFVDVCVGRNV